MFPDVQNMSPLNNGLEIRELLYLVSYDVYNPKKEITLTLTETFPDIQRKFPLNNGLEITKNSHIQSEL